MLDAIASIRRNWGGSDFTSYENRARKAAAQIAAAAVHPMNDDVHDEDTPIPGVGPGENYVPQGLFVDEDGNICTTMYDADDKTQGVMFIQNAEGEIIARIPLGG